MGVRNWMVRQAGAAKACARRFGRSTHGNVAMIFALTLPILVMLTMGGVDISRASTARLNLQDALDAATLAAARSSATTDADLKEIGLRALRANLAGYSGVTLDEANTTFTLNEDQVVIASARANVRAMVANIVLPPYGQLLDDNMPVGVHSEVNRSSKNIEVALVVDITGSMDNCTRNCPPVSKIAALKAAANQLVTIVVQPVQTPYYSRMSIIPYSIGVNMGSYADGARGAPTQSVDISGAAWTTGTSKSMSGATRASPGVITTSANHQLVSGDFVWISGVEGMTQLNNRAYRVVKTGDKTFSLERFNNGSWSPVNTTSGNGYNSYTRNGTVRKCLVSDCSVVITANGHNLPATTTDTGTERPGTVYITNVSGLSLSGASLVNNKPFEIANVTHDTFSIGVNGAGYSDYSSGGKSWCGQDGCQYRAFRRWSDNALTAVPVSNCISERSGSHAYDDVGPTTAKVGRNYAASANACPSATIQPLTDSISTLTTQINSLAAIGSTGAQTGFAWGWYTVSPNFNSLWSGNTAGAYNTRETLKAVILMTDGEFNSPYCTGVIAQDAANPGSGLSEHKITCNAHNGSSYAQAAALCTAMKLQNIVVYTVGFTVPADSPGAQVLADCATGPDHAFLPASGEDLSDDFAAIGRDITRLRISK